MAGKLSHLYMMSQTNAVITISYQHLECRVLLAHKFELSEPCEVFFNRWVKYFYLLIVIVVCFFIARGMATVVGSAWATNIPQLWSFSACSAHMMPLTTE